METNEVSRLNLRSVSSGRAGDLFTVSQFIRVTAISRAKSSSKRSGSRPVRTPKYQDNQVNTAVNCSFESLPGKEQENLVVDFTDKHMLSGYLPQHAVTTITPLGLMNKFKLLRKLKSMHRPRRAFLKDSKTSPTELSVLMTQSSHKRHRKVTSLVHNPLSNGLAKVKEMEARKRQATTFMSPLALGSGSRIQSPRPKRSKSVIQDGRSSYRRLLDIDTLRLTGSAVTPDRPNTSSKAPHLSNLYGKPLQRRSPRHYPSVH